MNVIIQLPKYIIPFNLGALTFEPKLKILVSVSKNILLKHTSFQSGQKKP